MSEEITDCGQTAYEAWQNLPAAPKETKLWHLLKNAERDGWRAIARAVLDAALTGPKKPTTPIVDNCEAYIEARLTYRRAASGTLTEMRAFWDENRTAFRHDERLVMANGDILEDMAYEP